MHWAHHWNEGWTKIHGKKKVLDLFIQLSYSFPASAHTHTHREGKLLIPRQELNSSPRGHMGNFISNLSQAKFYLPSSPAAYLCCLIGAFHSCWSLTKLIFYFRWIPWIQHYPGGKSQDCANQGEYRSAPQVGTCAKFPFSHPRCHTQKWDLPP